MTAVQSPEQDAEGSSLRLTATMLRPAMSRIAARNLGVSDTSGEARTASTAVMQQQLLAAVLPSGMRLQMTLPWMIDSATAV